MSGIAGTGRSILGRVKGEVNGGLEGGTGWVCARCGVASVLLEPLGVAPEALVDSSSE